MEGIHSTSDWPEKLHRYPESGAGNGFPRRSVEMSLTLWLLQTSNSAFVEPKNCSEYWWLKVKLAETAGDPAFSQTRIPAP